jgi:glutamate-1-semialdehyde 2,1-aminomutase
MIDSNMAAVIIEPVQGSNPRSDIKKFLKKLRKKCDEVGVLLIYDEVMTGFRISEQGAAGIFKIRPDIVTYGKVLGGGFPIGAVGGKKEIMKTKNVFYGGTFSANPLSMYAASLVLETIVNKKYIQYDKLNQAGNLFREELNKYFVKEQKNMRVIGIGPLNRIIFTEKFIKNRSDRDKYEIKGSQEAFSKKLAKLGVFVNGNGLYHLSMSHNTSVIKELIKKIKLASQT